MTTIVNTFKRIGIRTRIVSFNRAALACASEFRRVKAGLKQSTRVVDTVVHSKGAAVSAMTAGTHLSSRDVKLLACSAVLVVLSQAFFVGKI